MVTRGLSASPRSIAHCLSAIRIVLVDPVGSADLVLDHRLLPAASPG